MRLNIVAISCVESPYRQMRSLIHVIKLFDLIVSRESRRRHNTSLTTTSMLVLYLKSTHTRITIVITIAIAIQIKMRVVMGKLGDAKDINHGYYICIRFAGGLLEALSSLRTELSVRLGGGVC